MFESFRNIMKALFSLHLAFQFLTLLMMGGVALVVMLIYIAQGELDQAIAHLPLVACVGGIVAFLAWVRRDVDETNASIELRRKLRQFRLARDQEKEDGQRPADQGVVDLTRQSGFRAAAEDTSIQK